MEEFKATQEEDTSEGQLPDEEQSNWGIIPEDHEQQYYQQYCAQATSSDYSYFSSTVGTDAVLITATIIN